MASLINLYKRLSERIDLPFLLFLLTISSNKIYLKIFALLLIFALRPKFDFIFSKKLPTFYPFIMILATLQFLFLGRDFSAEHLVVFAVGILYWFICYAYMYQTYLFAKQNSGLRINQTIRVYVLLNFALCLFNYFEICVKTHTLFPFLLGEGEFGASTGDHITGLFGRPSYINAMVNSLLALYFIHSKKVWLFIIATFCAFLSFANIINLIFIVILVIYAIFAGSARKRVFIVANILLCFFMYVFISPDNYVYMKKTIGLSVGNENEIMPEVVIAKSENHDKTQLPNSVKYINDSSASTQKILMYDRDFLFKRKFDEYTTYYPVDIKASPGKKIAVLQTIRFMKANPMAAVFGAGIGNFSSRLAYQFSGRDSSRLFLKLPHYCHGYYFKNNLLIYDSMRQLPNEYHSIKHFPNNFFSQLFGEYGIIGFVLFVVFYLYFFYKRANNKFFFAILLLCASCYLMLDYMYEFFNLMVIFEMLLFIDSKPENDVIPETTTA